MRVIYLLRGVQLLLTLRALWMLYSVSSFCEKTKISMNQCSDYLHRIPFATPDQIAEHLRIKAQRSASNRPVNTTSNPTSPSSKSTTTTQETPTSESSTVTSSIEEIKSRKKRDEARILPDNGITEGKPKEVKSEKEEIKKDEEKKVEMNTTPSPTHVEEKKDQAEVKKEEQKPEPSVVKKSEEKSEVKKEDTNSTTTSTTVPSTVSDKYEKKEHLGAKVEIPVAVEASTIAHPEEKKVDNKTDHAHFSNDDKPHHTVKKDLKTHVQEPVELEKKEVSARVPNITVDQQRFVLEHSYAFLQEVRCLEVTSDDYFGKQLSPFSEHLKGLVFVGPVLVVICIYLVCTVLRARLGSDNPSEFVDTLGRIFIVGMWTLVSLTLAWIAKYWTENWNTVSAGTFLPEFPCAWYNLAILASFMSMTASIEMWFHKRLYDNIVLERSYRCYEVIDNSEAVPDPLRLSRTNVY